MEIMGGRFIFVLHGWLSGQNLDCKCRMDGTSAIVKGSDLWNSKSLVTNSNGRIGQTRNNWKLDMQTGSLAIDSISWVFASTIICSFRPVPSPLRSLTGKTEKNR
jgi:hypothetical protein